MPLIDELKRRNVFKVGVAYLALAWVVVQATGAIVPALNLPASLVPTVVWIGVIGFPCALLFAWVFELTPEGLRRESEIDRSQSITQQTGRKLDYLIIAMLAVAIGLFLFDRFVPRDTGADGDSRAEARPTEDTGPVAAVSAESAVGRASARQQPADPAAPAPDARSIAVLPFVNMSSDKEQDYFSDGISEELLNLLARVPQLKVAARTSSFSFRDTRLEIPQIAAKLGVAHILEGSVRKSGERVRITAQLIRAADGYHVWSQTWDRTLDDIFAVQDEIAGSVVSQLKITLLGEAPKSRVTDPRAYTLFLRGRQLAEQFTPEAYEESNAVLQQVLEIDPNYPEALRKLAANCVNQAGFGLLPIDEAYRQARTYIDRALAIDPEYGRGYDGLAYIALTHDLDIPAAARNYLRALELDPANLDILTNANTAALALGRVDLAIAMMEYVVTADPVNALTQSNLATPYYLAGRFDDAAAANRTAALLSPGFLGAQAFEGWALLMKGDAEAALAVIGKETSELLRLPARAAALHALGRQAESDAALAETIAKYERSAPYQIATALAYRGENDRAFEWLDKARAYHDGSLYIVGQDPAFRNLHADARWLPFLRTLGLAPEQLAAIPFDVKLPE